MLFPYVETLDIAQTVIVFSKQFIPALFDPKENTIAKSHDAARACPLFCDSGHDNEWWIPFA